jgi:uncharacterized protein (DUF736 family)
MIIGKFQTNSDGKIVGDLQALGLGTVNLTFTPNEKGADYTVTFSELGIEAGAAWKKTSREGGKEFLSVKLDSPALAKPINAAMFAARDKAGAYVMVWDRQEPKAEQTA